MENDNIMPNDGSTFYLPKEIEEEVVSRKKEKAKTLEKLAVLKEIIEYLEGRIAFYGSVDSIPDVVKVDPEKFMHVAAANSLTKACLITEKEYIEGLLQQYAPNL